MWDEIFGIGAFIVLFVGGLVIYHFVERWRERKRSEQERPPRERR
jgi:hypothetical protein